MNLKSITFRCSSTQNARITEYLNSTNSTRTDLITQALESFLDFAEQDQVRALDLFELVATIDGLGNGPDFATQA